MNLQLSLKKQWFEMTKSGEKTEDYREITPYWCTRLFFKTDKEILMEDLAKELMTLKKREIDDYIDLYGKIFIHNKTTLGYPKKADMDKILLLEHKGIEIRTGNPEWGAEEGKLYFVIKHGAILA
jgi:hypothetical protein